ncbi:Mitochondrial amidoxime-reducing component 1 [Cryptotermes secundus]|uniref:Mitochondrial amidoxime-reducing component 1 n=1 Tax=Cryptotermes secundus TaxID=105785 RepID=A0A2J7R8V7_9NEOP|nr:mitochondrial amidoxime-reducing component 1-like isoform X2 [Cryptotermes secundus]PNF37256.1 Mitochondrial amidoxime-reducing component 1 [Cryptotermes secundus]
MEHEATASNTTDMVTMSEPVAVITSQNTTLVIGMAAVLLTVAVAWWHQRIQGRKKIPTKWRQVGEVSEMTIYPLKSGRGVDLKEAFCTDLGLRTIGDETTQLLDRTFLVFGSDDRTYMTAARFPKMLLITITAGSDGIVTFRAPDMPPLPYRIPDSNEDLTTSTCIVWWSEEVQTLDCGEEAATWFSKYILGKDTGARLGYYAQENPTFRRDISKVKLTAFQQHYKKLRDHDVGAYTYLSGFMLLSESTMDDLRSRLPERLRDLSHKRFRGNFIARGTIPYEEDKWDWVKVGEQAIFRTVKPCTRCIIINVDPEMAVRDPEFEPLRTLRSYRLVKTPGARDVEGVDPIMGVYLGLHFPGVVKEGDPIYVGCE